MASLKIITLLNTITIAGKINVKNKTTSGRCGFVWCKWYNFYSNYETNKLLYNQAFSKATSTLDTPSRFYNQLFWVH